MAFTQPFPRPFSKAKKRAKLLWKVIKWCSNTKKAKKATKGQGHKDHLRTINNNYAQVHPQRPLSLLNGLYSVPKTSVFYSICTFDKLKVKSPFFTSDSDGNRPLEASNNKVIETWLYIYKHGPLSWLFLLWPNPLGQTRAEKPNNHPESWNRLLTSIWSIFS